ncbi:MAG: short-chain dehydrogenase [Gemmatimonadales bacterium]
MDLAGKNVLILGGSGLVGRAIARRLFVENPASVVLVALGEDEVQEAVEDLTAEAGNTEVKTFWGNVFLPADAARLGWSEMLSKEKLRALVISDLLGELTGDVVQRSLLFQAFQRYKPEVVIDCINTATAFAYRDVFSSAQDLLSAARDGSIDQRQIEEHILTLTTPQLIRHVQIVVEAMRAAGTRAYVKIGTSGTGGMGFNIPYTHSEERPSRTLLTKSAVAGAHSLLLFLLGRTPGGPATIEIKPTAAIAWRDIEFGTVHKKRIPVRRFDCPKALSLEEAFESEACGWLDTGSLLEAPFIDVGENGLFARDEFQTVTSLGQMEFITPEEVAEYVIMELQGRPTGRDIVAALDAATAGPTYRAGLLREIAVEKLKQLEVEHGVRVPAFEMLGPPRLSKLIYEAFLLSRLCDTVRDLAGSDESGLSEAAVQLVCDDKDLRSAIISIGLPIIIPGEKIYRAVDVLVPPVNGDIERAAANGWVDLRPANLADWIRRARRMAEQSGAAQGTVGSNIDWDIIDANDLIEPSRFATWIFHNEDGGRRIKR